MTDFIHQAGPVLNWLVASGAIAGAFRALLWGLKKRRAGISARDGKRRLDLVSQLTAALAYAHRLREVLLEHDVPLSAIPRWPEPLKEQEQA